MDSNKRPLRALIKASNLVLDSKLFAFKFNDTEVIGVGALKFLYNFCFQGFMPRPQRVGTLIWRHTTLPLGWFSDNDTVTLIR